MDLTIHEATGDPARVVIAGGGVAGIEAMLALRELAGGHVEMELLAPDPYFHYRPLAVAEPFGLAEPRSVAIESIAHACGARYRRDALASVDPALRLVETASGEELPYDALLLAIGTRGKPAVEGALTFGAGGGLAEFGKLLDDVDAGSVRRVAFLVPSGAVWSLPLYELALMTAERVRRAGVRGVELTVVTHEQRPLAIFGRQASARVSQLLRERDVKVLRDSVARRVEDGELQLVGGGSVAADAVVSLPRLSVPRIPGVPQDATGFIPTDPHGRVVGLDGVYAAGDATSFPIKQGGIATQQADAAAEAIAAAAGARVEARPAHLVLRGALLTGAGPEFLHSDPAEGRSLAARGAMWWPPGKIAGRYLAPYLSGRDGERFEAGHMVDLAPDFASADSAAAEAGHLEALQLALEAADAEAGWGDYETALKWLDVAEGLNVVLPQDYVERRREWRAATAA